MIKGIIIQMVSCVSLFLISSTYLPTCHSCLPFFFFRATHLNVFHIYRFLNYSNSWWYMILMSKEKEKAIISSYIPFHGPFSPRVKFNCSCLGRCFHSLIMKTPNVPQRAQEQAKAGGGRECPGTLCSLICKQVFSFNLGYCATFLKTYWSSLQLRGRDQITRVLVARLWEQHTDMFSLFL